MSQLLIQLQCSCIYLSVLSVVLRLCIYVFMSSTIFHLFTDLKSFLLVLQLLPCSLSILHVALKDPTESCIWFTRGNLEPVSGFLTTSKNTNASEYLDQS